MARDDGGLAFGGSRYDRVEQSDGKFISASVDHPGIATRSMPPQMRMALWDRWTNISRIELAGLPTP